MKIASRLVFSRAIFFKLSLSLFQYPLWLSFCGQNYCVVLLFTELHRGSLWDTVLSLCADSLMVWKFWFHSTCSEFALSSPYTGHSFLIILQITYYFPFWCALGRETAAVIYTKKSFLDLCCLDALMVLLFSGSYCLENLKTHCTLPTQHQADAVRRLTAEQNGAMELLLVVKRIITTVKLGCFWVQKIFIDSWPMI